MTYYVGNYGIGNYSSNYGRYNHYNTAASSANLNRISNDIASGSSSDINIINLSMKQGNIDEALAKYEELFGDVRESAADYGYELSDGQISSIVEKAYVRETGTSLTGSIEKNTSNPFVTGLKNGIPIVGWFFGQHDSNADALAKLSGTKAPAKATAAECTGGAISGAAFGAGIGLGTAALVVAKAGTAGAVLFGTAKGAAAGSAAGPIGIAIGAGIGLLAGIIVSLVNRK